MIVIGFSRGNSWLSAAIRWFTDSEWSHCWVEYPSHVWGGRWIAHAADRGVIKEPAEPKIRRWEPDLARYEAICDLSMGFEAARGCVGKRYDWLSIAGHALRLLAHKVTGGWFGNPHRDAARLTCSEFVAIILQEARVPGTDFWDVESIAPGDVHRLCEGSDLFRKL